MTPPTSELDAAIAAYQKVAREYRDSGGRRERTRRELSRAEEEHIEAGAALHSARERLDKALDAEAALWRCVGAPAEEAR